jgi:hypothetical protein
MESLVLSIVAKYLKDYVNNFRKDQISVNFLRGQGVIRDLDINVDAINELFIQSACPAIKVSKLLINTLSINAPIMSLKTRPIVVFIDELFVELTEVPVCTAKSNLLSQGSSPSKATSKDKKDKPTKYGFLDRVGDSLSFEINRVSLAFTTLGKIKTVEIGLWTPPVLLVELLGSRFFCTNHNGIETDLDSCFRVRQTKRPILFIYKKLLSKRIRIHLVNAMIWPKVREDIINGWSSKESLRTIRKRYGEPRGGYAAFQIIENTAMSIQMCFRKRIENNTLLGLEIAVVIGAIKQSFRQKCFSQLLHLVHGINNCMMRSDVVVQSLSPAEADQTTTRETESLRQKVKLNREQLGLDNEEAASLDILEAEAFAGVSAESTQAAYDDSRAGEGWQRSSLNSDEDPPHIRLVISTQIDELVVTFPFDGMQREFTIDQLGKWEEDYVSVSGSEDETDNVDADVNGDGEITADNDESTSMLSFSRSRSGSPRTERPRKEFIHGIILTMSGLVHSNIWPEHAGYTETVSQLTVKHVSLHEYSGINKSCLFRTTKPLDSDGRPLVVALLPRGVKENSLGDPEYLPGTSILLKTDSCWPSLPSPDRNGIVNNTEVHVCALDIAIKLPILLEMATFFSVAADPRWDSCQWGSGIERMIKAGEVKLFSAFPPGNSAVAVVVNGIRASYFPNLTGDSVSDAESVRLSQQPASYTSLNTVRSFKSSSREYGGPGSNRVNSLQASQINLDINLVTVQCRHTLDATFLNDCVPNRSKSRDCSLLTKDLTDSMPWEKYSSTLPLMSPRLEATLSSIRVSIVTDDLDKVYVASNPMGDASPHFKDIIKPFTLCVFTSLDPIPEKISETMDGLNEVFSVKATSFAPSLFATLCPVQNRLFYWPRCPFCIETTYIGIEDFVVDMSLLDLIFLTKTAECIRDQIKELDVVGWFFTLFPSAGRKKKFSSDFNSALHVPIPQVTARDLDLLGPLGRVVVENSPNEIWMISASNVRVSVLPANASSSSQKGSSENVFFADQEIVGLILKSASAVYERESATLLRYKATDTAAEDENEHTAALLVKAACSGIAASVSGRPILFLNVDPIQGIVHRSCSSNVCPTKWLSEAPTILFRYDTRTSLLHTIASDLTALNGLPHTESETASSVSAIVHIEATSDCCLVLQPRSVLLVLQGCVAELLKGVGCVNTNYTNWWEDSIFGFFRTHLDNFIGGDSRKGVIVQATRQQLVKVSKKHDPVLLVLAADNARVAIVDVLDALTPLDGAFERSMTPFAAGRGRATESPLFFHKPSMQSSNHSLCLLLTLHQAQATGRLRSGEKPLVALDINSRLQFQLIQFDAVTGEYYLFFPTF